jgi:hypothetical protein
MYVREAHPNPDTAPCGSTEELGWSHPSSSTRSQEERAQRARWLQNDYDLTFPYVIDFVDDRIKEQYLTFGFYAGWVIDCDGTVLVFEPWAWATSDTQWCGLPLADMSGLGAALDAYLASPPACYVGVRRDRFETMVPAAANAPGDEGTTWVSDVTITNPGDGEAAVTLLLHRHGSDNSDPASTSVVVDAGTSLELGNALASGFDFEGTAALRLVADRPVVVMSRTVNSARSGAFGQLIPGLSPKRAIGEHVIGHLLLIEESDAFRTNVGVASWTAAPAEVEVRFFDGGGRTIGTVPASLPPYGFVQLNRVLRNLTAETVIGARAEVEVLTAGGRVLAYASVVDNRTGDPTFIEAAVNTYSSELTLAAVARLQGSNDTDWVTDVTVYNARDADVTVQLLRHQRDVPNHSPQAANRTLGTGETVLLRDLLGSVFGAGGAAAVSMQADQGLLAVGRTYNTTADGTYGQVMPGLDEVGRFVLRPGDVGHLVQLEQASEGGRRTNLGAVNLGEGELRLEVRLVDGSGTAIGEPLAWSLPARGVEQHNSVLAFAGVPDVRNARAEVRVLTDGGRALAYASVVDNTTGDPVFQVARTVDD